MNRQSILAQVEAPFKKEQIPSFKPGDKLKIHFRVIEGENERIQIFEGDVIARKGGGIRESITVRKLSSGVGVERIFPLHSPRIAKIECVKKGNVSRAKLYYLRDRVGKSARIEEMQN